MTDPLFRPIAIGTLTLPNRVVMAPMGQGQAPGGQPDPGYAGFYRRRAEGEVGLIISGATAIGHPTAALDDYEPHFHGGALDEWARIVREVHEAGGRIVPQLGHAGLQGIAAAAPAWPGIGPSGIWLPGAQAGMPAGPERADGHAMTLDDIDEVIAAFVRAARDAQALGFDGIEVHAAHGFLIDQFLWTRTNRRADAYGGERARFAAEIVAACRAATGPDFPILMRLSQFKMTDYDATLADDPAGLEALLAPIADAGVDLFDCSQRRFWRAEFAGSPLNFAGWAKKLTGRPTIGGGGIGLEKTALEYGDDGIYARQAEAETSHLEELRARLDRGEFDLVSLGRAILGDPAWARKVRDGAAGTLQPYRPELLGTLA
ncbi:12-oxophytodienoate reductase [Croceicoccus estronivorus]|uniref:oxidoreductase n=1 Tax=Croceicoccus estronivorus TaxID=1172626 RepID=UPI00082DFDD8|nr:12-oxophytodienoate reductase [Croceicoccus estronivorus]OCC23037.1 12-oxophytodienoate reductase [Croceicoccus estronivorus]